MEIFDANDARTLAEAALRSITDSTARARGEEFFRVLVRDLAAALDVTYVIAGRVIRMPDGQEGIRTLAVWGGQGFLPNMEYSLEHTPCHNVTDQTMCFHGCGIQQDYPLDTLLVDMNAESYVGMPMVDTEGRTLGILSAIDTKAIDENKRLLALSLLSIFTGRAAAELQHQEREHQLEEKVMRRTEALRSAQASLVEQEKLAALGSLVAGVAHEVNTPVGVALTAASAMSSYTAQLVQALDAPKVSRSDLVNLAARLNDAAALIEQNLHRAAALIGNFKQLAVDQGTEHVSTLALKDYVQGVVSAHSPELRKAGIKVEVEMDHLLRPRLPPGKFSQVLSNLLMNAARHAYPDGQGGSVIVRAEMADGWLDMDFIDHGVGLAPGVRERIYEPFFTTKRGQGGSGLGMHIVYTIMQQLGGAVEVHSEPGKGCRFHLHMPFEVKSAPPQA